MKKDIHDWVKIAENPTIIVWNNMKKYYWFLTDTIFETGAYGFPSKSLNPNARAKVGIEIRIRGKGFFLV